MMRLSMLDFFSQGFFKFRVNLPLASVSHDEMVLKIYSC
jgi:hypothetical protein